MERWKVGMKEIWKDGRPKKESRERRNELRMRGRKVGRRMVGKWNMEGYRDIYSGHFPPLGGGVVQIEKQGEEFEGGLHEREKGGKEEKRVIKHTLKYLDEA